MNNIRCIIIHFDYGGYYSNNGGCMDWIQSEDEIYTLVMKKSIEEVTYYELFQSICMKMMRDEATTKLKLSYVPQADPKRRPSFILNDVDCFGYLMAYLNDKSGSILHVEVMEDVLQNQEYEEVLRRGVGSESIVNDGIISLYGEEPSEYGLVNNDDGVTHDDGFAYMDNSASYEYNQVTHVVEEGEGGEEEGEGGGEEEEREGGGGEGGSGEGGEAEIVTNEHVNVAWEDEIDVLIDQEFDTRDDVHLIVQTAGHSNCFEFDIIKSDLTRYVVKCSEAASGCKWMLRAAVLKNSKFWSIRTHNKMHTCSRVSSTSTHKRKGTQRLVASFLHKKYPGILKTPVPKEIMGLV